MFWRRGTASRRLLSWETPLRKVSLLCYFKESGLDPEGNREAVGELTSGDGLAG